MTMKQNWISKPGQRLQKFNHPLVRSLVLGVWLLSLSSPALAATENPRSLTKPKADPLLPSLTLNRPLSPLERRLIEETILQLDRDAQQLLETGQNAQAFDLWFRVLNLQRSLGRSQEIIGLGTIGEQAWKTGQRLELQSITDRLHRLEMDLRKSPQQTLSPDGKALGLAYQQVRDLNAAQTFYQFQLQLAQQQQDTTAMAEILTELIAVQWGALNYPLATDYTQQKLTVLRSGPVTVQSLQEERSLLISLAFLAKQIGDYPTQISALEETIALTLDLGLAEEIPTLWTALGDAYQANNQLDLAIRSYYQGYAFAQENQQYEAAQTILGSLGQLQETAGQLRDAIQTYELLRQVHRYSSNLLGLLDSYDRLGQLYLQLQQPEQAQEQFQQGLTLARRLKYRESEFEAHLQQF
jgi:tetratricopeptide (TPR) repeat protein